jgi:putative ABC transport system permease protein
MAGEVFMWIRRFWLKLQSLFGRNRNAQRLDDEIQFHLDQQIAENLAAGMNRQEAQYAAMRTFGNPTYLKEETRHTWGWIWLEQIRQDLRYGLRLLRKSPGFTTVAVLTIALGIGANAAIFGLVDSELLHAVPFSNIERLAYAWTTDAGGDLHSPLPNQYLALRKYSQAFEQVAATGWVDNFYGSDETGWQNLTGRVVSSNWLPTLGVQPLLGRNFREGEQVAGQDAVVILSYSCWHKRFYGDPNIVGTQIVLNRRPVTVVGVLPKSLEVYNGNVEIFAPLVLESYLTDATFRVAGTARVHIMARLKPGVTLAQARSETETIAQGLRSSAAPEDRSGHLVVWDSAQMARTIGPTTENAHRGLWMTAVASGVVLLIACANVASFLLARGVKRNREVAVRSALGCSRGRMVRQLLIESTLLFLLGGSLGLLAARSSNEVISKVASGILWNNVYVEINARILLIGLGVCLFSALFFGMIPALQATRVNLNATLKDAIHGTASGPMARQPRNLLVMFQVALGMVLLVGFGLLFRSLLHVESAPFGFDPHNVLTATVSLPVSRYSDAPAKALLMRHAVERVREMPAVESVGIADSLPMNGADTARLSIETPSSKPASIGEEINYVSVSSEYFSSLKIPMLRGRTFRETDTREAGPVAVVNRTFANTYFPDTDPLTCRLAFADSPTAWREIVGVVSDFRQRNPEEDLRPVVYLPVAQSLPGRWSMTIRVRAANDVAAVAAAFSNQLTAVDPKLYWEMGSMRRQIYDSESLTLRRPIITLLACFGSLALILVIVGVFGVTSYSVAERTREIGIRTALGAARLKIAGLVFRESLKVTFAGLAVGTFCAFAVTRFFPTKDIGWSGSGIFLYGVSRTDSLTYGFAAALIISVVLAATWIPARRAMRVDPIEALRYE